MNIAQLHATSQDLAKLASERSGHQARFLRKQALYYAIRAARAAAERDELDIEPILKELMDSFRGRELAKEIVEYARDRR